MSRMVTEELSLADSREFSLIDYRHGHTYAVFRGYPPMDDAAEGSPPRVLDIFFPGPSRISCGKDIGSLHLRRAAGAEHDLLLARLGGIRQGHAFYLLGAETIEDYVVGPSVCWAEFDLPPNALSPLASDDPAYRMANPPIGGFVHFAE